jgi:hypothetical protein
MTITDLLPLPYKLYMEQFYRDDPIGEEYFSDEHKEALLDAITAQYNKTGDISGIVSSFDETNPVTGGGAGQDIFESLSGFEYDINRPRAPTFDDPTVTISDKYNWNPVYSEHGWTPFSLDPRSTYQAVTEEGEHPERVGDVNAAKMAKYLFNRLKHTGTYFNFLEEYPNRWPYQEKYGRYGPAEMVGNWLGPRASEGEGRDVSLTLPFDFNRSTEDMSMHSLHHPNEKRPGIPLNVVNRNMERTESRVDPSGNVRAYGLNRGGIIGLL